MPIYVYKHPDEEEYREVLQGMNDEHSHEEDGVKWERVFFAPNAAVDSDIDPFNNQSFIDATYNKKGSYGDMIDYSHEQSERRAAQRGGVDPIKQQYYKKYAEERGGKRHPDELKKTYESKNVKVDYD